MILSIPALLCLGSVRRAFRGAFAILLILLLSLTSRAAEAPGAGAIEGRVLNVDTGDYLENARVTLEGTGQQVLTDSLGAYRFNNVPAGTANVRVFYTGVQPDAAIVTVTAGQVAQHDFSLRRAEAPAGREDAIKLGEYVVSTTREMDAAAIAINEKRFATDIRNVIAADEFGPMADGNVGEILKSVPGVAIDYVGGSAMGISLNGVPSGYVPVTMNGFPLASTTATAPTARDVELVNVATNNLARIEVLHSPTPESPANALGGSVNMVPRGAFERAKPLFVSNLYVLMRDDARSLDRTPGPGPGYTYKVLPGVDFSYVNPVNKQFGFTISGGTSQQYQPSYFVQTNWRGVAAATNGTTFPTTTPDKPYLTDYIVRDFPRMSRRSSAGITLDYKFNVHDRVSVSLQSTRFDAQYNERDLTFSITRVAPTDFSLAYTHGAPGGGTLTLANANDRDRRNQNFTPSVIFYHNGPIWKAEAGAGWSLSTSEIRNMGKGYFANVNATRSNVTINFDDIFYLRPRSITVKDGTTGAPVDPYNVNTYNITSGSGNWYGPDTVLGVGPGSGIANQTKDTARNAYVNVKRDFAWGIPITVKSGLDIRQSIRDYRGGTTTLNFLGADGRANTADDNAAQIYDPVYSQRPGIFGFPRTDRVSGSALWDLYQQHPTWFTKNDATIYTSAVNLSKHAQEVVSSWYVRGDAALFENRLKLTGGVRAEQTNVKAEGPLTDPTLNFQRDAKGNILDGNPSVAGIQPVLIAPAGSLAAAKLTSVDRGSTAKKEYLRWFPSINASYNIRENLVARAAYYYSIGRPDYNQYSGGLTLPDESLAPGPNNPIRVSNVGIKPWTAKSVRVALEYYFQQVGLVSVSAFHRDFKNFFTSTTFAATPEFLALYNLDPAQFNGVDVVTQYNLNSIVRSDGFDVQYKQALTFLPQWARGFQVFANGAVQRFTGDQVDNLANFTPKTASWGVSFTRPKYNLKVNWTYKSHYRRAAVTGQGIEPGTYAWGTKRLLLDVMGEYSLSRNVSVFANLRNLLDTPEDFSREGPHTPAVAQFRQTDRYGALWMFGLKGTF